MSSVRTKERNATGDGGTIRVPRVVVPGVRGGLGALARIYATDRDTGHTHPPLYERHLSSLRNRPVNLLEIGVAEHASPTRDAASLRMWRQYFRRGQIHGLSIAGKKVKDSRIHVHRGNQSDPAFLPELARCHGPFDIVIDHGSHLNNDVLTSFEVLFVDHMKPGGFYVIEDLSTAYRSECGGGPPGHPGTSIELIRDLLDDLNRRFWSGRSARPVRSLHVYEKIAFIQRA